MKRIVYDGVHVYDKDICLSQPWKRQIWYQEVLSLKVYLFFQTKMYSCQRIYMFIYDGSTYNFLKKFNNLV